MPKLKCICDNIIDLGEIPSPNQLLIISDEEFDKFEGNVDAEEIFQAMKIVAKCSKCFRLHIFWNGFENDAEIYSLDRHNKI